MSERIDGRFDGQQTDRADSHLHHAFGLELTAAEADLHDVPWVDGIPRPTWKKPSREVPTPMMGRSRRAGRLLQGAVVAIVVVVASVGMLVPALMRTGTGAATPSGTEAGSPSGTATATRSASADALRYGDGIPRTWEGLPVLRGQAALDAANESADESAFLVAFWAGIELPHSCPNLGAGAIPLFTCGAMLNVGDQPGIVSAPLGRALRVDSSAVAPAPVIARVHTHDPALMACPPSDVFACEHIMVGEAILWSGDQATVPHPATVAQAASAFGVSPVPMNTVCEGERLPGVPVLPFTSPEYPGAKGVAEGIVAVFPSAEALAAAAPDAAAHGESDVPPGGSLSCDHTGNDPLRGQGMISFKIHWLARGNVLVGVQYDTSVGPDNDPIVAQARTKLQTLPAG